MFVFYVLCVFVLVLIVGVVFVLVFFLFMVVVVGMSTMIYYGCWYKPSYVINVSCYQGVS